jgi:tRNA-2-methylthio-N6-dimethylallyladenosine synthase
MTVVNAMTDMPELADVILLSTCAIRDNAEKKIHERLNHLKYYKKRNKDLVVGILGCMAERLRETLLEKELVDLVVGPDEYRTVPELISKAYSGEKGIAVKLEPSRELMMIFSHFEQKASVLGYLSCVAVINSAHIALFLSQEDASVHVHSPQSLMKPKHYMIRVLRKSHYLDRM